MNSEQIQRARAIVDAYFDESGAGDIEFLAEDGARLLHELLEDEPHARNRRRIAGACLLAAGLALGALWSDRPRPCFEDEIRIDRACVPLDKLAAPRDVIEVYALDSNRAGIRVFDGDGNLVTQYVASQDAPLSVAFDW